MQTASTLALIEAITKLLSALSWPFVAVLVLAFFGPNVRKLIKRSSQFSVEVAGVKLLIKQNEAAFNIGAAAARRPEVGTTPVAAALVVSEISSRKKIRLAEGATVLWVDDNPSNNINERQSLEAFGIRFVSVTSTEAALDKISLQSFDVIISDMKRPGDSQAGFTLLDKLREMGDQTPLLIYAGAVGPELRAESKTRGAGGCTNRPDELFSMVFSVLPGRRNKKLIH
jgi:CheY-like chemotaxis protein